METGSILTRERRLALARFFRNWPAVFGLVIVLVTIITSILAPQLAPFDPAEQFFDGLTLTGMPLPPNETYLLGTDLLGRDLLSRVIYGARVSLVIGVVANGAAVIIGTIFGTIAGYFQGRLGMVIMRFTDLMMAFPALLLAIALTAILRPSMWIVALVIALVNWVQIARVVYSQVLSIRQRDFIQAAIALGSRTGRILFRHVIPHLIPTLVVWGTLGIGTTVLLEATLSFLGVGVQPPMPSWGGIINESQSYFIDAPWLIAFPGLAILLMSLSFNLVGDALRDLTDPERGGSSV